MLQFIEFLNEHVLSIGYNPAHEKFREKHRQEIHDLMHHGYKKIGGYSGHESGSPEESKAIHNDISDHDIKAVVRNGKISAVNIYKNQKGRKLIAAATDRTEQGKRDWTKISTEDNQHKRAWGEVSGAVEHVHKKIGFPKIPSSKAKELIGKDVTPKPGDNYEYSRKIGKEVHSKTMMGHYKDK